MHPRRLKMAAARSHAKPANAVARVINSLAPADLLRFQYSAHLLRDSEECTALLPAVAGGRPDILLLRQIRIFGWDGTDGSTDPAGFRADLPLCQPEENALTGDYRTSLMGCRRRVKSRSGTETVSQLAERVRMS